MIEYLNQISAYWADFFGLMIIQNTIFLAIIFVILALLKNNSAQIKYIVSVTGIIKLLLPPFLPFYSSGLVNPMQPLTLSALAPQSTNAVTGTAGMAAKTLPHTLDIFDVLFIAWTVFTLLYLILALGSTFMLYLKLSTAKPVHENVQQKAHLKLLQSNYISTPLSIGLAPKNVFLPSFFKALPQQCQQVLINHELAHIKRRDGVFQLLQILAQAVYFFHPLVWLLNERVNEYREMACDDTAIKQANLSPTEYSRYLVHMAEKMVQPCWAYNSATALIRQKNKLTQRVNYLLKEAAMKKSSTKTVKIALLLLCALAIPLSLYSSNKQEKVDIPTSESSTKSRATIDQDKIKETETNTPSEKQTVQTKVLEINPGKEPSFDNKGMEKTKTGKVWGHVRDKDSGKAIPGVHIYLKGADRYVRTDDQGNYYIPNVPPGVYIIQVSFDGFQSSQIKDVNIKAQKSTQADIDLKSAVEPPNPLKVNFVAYDEPPEPVGGYKEIQRWVYYPDIAKKTGMEGRVIVNALINEKGVVEDTKIVHSLGNNGCDESAVYAIKKVQWKPAKQRDRYISVWISIPVHFKLNQQAKN